jgi:hypothetical protein
VLKIGLKKSNSSIRMALTFSNKGDPMEENINVKQVSEKAKSYFDQGFN